MTQTHALVEAAWEILRESGTVTPAALAQRVGCLPESASNALRRLWRKGALTRTPAKRSGAPGAQGYVYRERPETDGEKAGGYCQ